MHFWYWFLPPGGEVLALVQFDYSSLDQDRGDGPRGGEPVKIKEEKEEEGEDKVGVEEAEGEAGVR
jgi:hypothetical protein